MTHIQVSLNIFFKLKNLNTGYIKIDLHHK